MNAIEGESASVLLAAATGTFAVDFEVPGDVAELRAFCTNLEVRQLTMAWLVGASSEDPVQRFETMAPPNLILPLPPKGAAPPRGNKRPVLRIRGAVTVPAGGGAYMTFIGRFSECRV